MSETGATSSSQVFMVRLWSEGTASHPRRWARAVRDVQRSVDYHFREASAFIAFLCHAAQATTASGGRADEGAASGVTVALLSCADAETAAMPGLRLFGLGEEQVCLGDRRLRPADWMYSVKAREMLFNLLSHPPRTKDQIALDLWPDASPDQVRQRFHDSLYRLRRCLGRPDWVIVDGDRYRFNRDLGYWYDVDVFEAGIADARRRAADQPAEAIRVLESALALYQGDFLADLDAGEWVMAHRERLRRLGGDALLSLAQFLFDQGHYARAVERYRQAIDHDDLEAAHRGLMRCYVRLGERGRALRHYHTLRARLATEYGAHPDRETTALYQRIDAGQAA